MLKKPDVVQQRLDKIYQNGLRDLDKFYHYKPTLSLSELSLTEEGLAKKRGRPAKILKEEEF
jgi:hypothetical protein